MGRKNSYSVDKNNQLIIKPGNKRAVLKPKGKFAIERNNALAYWLNEPAAWQREYGVPNKIKFKGSWQLDADYNLRLTLDKTKEQFEDDCLTLYGKIFSAGAEGLTFQIRSRDKRGVNRLSFLKLSGTWQANKLNQIIFQVDKKTSPDTLVFRETWQVNKNQEIVYEYERAALETKRKVKNTLAFSGFWQITSANRLRYILAGSSQSRFDFRVQVETPNVYPKEGVIKYRLGIGGREDLEPARIMIIPLYGTWKFSRRLGLSFKMEYGKRQVKALNFSTEVNLSKKDKIICELVDKRGERLGIAVTFRHRFLKNPDAEWFLRLKRDYQEQRGEIGVRIGF